MIRRITSKFGVRTPAGSFDSVEACAAHYGIDSVTAHRRAVIGWMTWRLVRIAQKSERAARDCEVTTRYRAGETTTALATEFGISRQRVHSIATKSGWRRRRGMHSAWSYAAWLAAEKARLNLRTQMSDHQIRVLEEKKLLDDKLVKLVRFISTSPVFAALPELEKSLLRQQRTIMSLYSEVLGERIALFDLSQTESVERGVDEPIIPLARFFSAWWGSGVGMMPTPSEVGRAARSLGLTQWAPDTSTTLTPLGRAAIKLAENKDD